jgi:hypothetical protein
MPQVKHAEQAAKHYPSTNSQGCTQPIWRDAKLNDERRGYEKAEHLTADFHENR